MDDAVRIENWSVGYCELDPPGTKVLFGEVHGHPRFPSGRAVCTSVIIDFDEDIRRVITQNTVYVLGERNDDFVEQFRSVDGHIARRFHQDKHENNKPDTKFDN